MRAACRSRLPLLLATALALTVAPATAVAQVYRAATAADLLGDLSAAASSPEADTIQLGASTYVGQFSYNGSSDLTIVGAGATRTTLGNSVGNQAALYLHSSGHATVEDLGVTIAGGTTAYGLQLSGANVVAQDVQLVDQPAGTNAMAVVTDAGATLRRATISGPFNRGVWAIDGAPVVDATTISGASTALEVEGVGTTLLATHMHISQVNLAAAANFSGALTLTDSLVLPATGSSIAAIVGDNGNSAANDSHATLARDTLVSTAANQTAVAVGADMGDAMSATVTDTILSGFATPLSCSAANGGAGSIITTNLDVASGTNSVSSCSPSSVRQTNTLTAAPQFVDAVGGNYRLRAGSPLIDVSALTPAGATDLDGHPRPSDGTGDCVRLGDVGAYELLLPPVASASAGAPTAVAGVGVAFTAGTACDSGSANPPVYHWAFDDGGSADGRVVSHAFATVGVHSATLTVADAEGQTATAHASVTIAPRPVASAPPPAPQILGFSAPRGGFTLGTGAPRLRGRSGRSLVVKLSEPATVTLGAIQLLPGRLRGGHCGPSSHAPHGRRCTRRLPAKATARLALPAGTSLVAFAGRLTARAALKPGRWELTLVARDAAGRTGRAQTIVVTIHAPPRHRPHR